jgi:hypothetical protein
MWLYSVGKTLKGKEPQKVAYLASCGTADGSDSLSSGAWKTVEAWKSE